MKKILFLIFTLALPALCLFSCAEDITIYSKAEEIKPSVILADSPESVETSAYNMICSALQDIVGRDGFYNKTDVYLEAEGEIIVGNSANRTATAAAIEFMNASYVEDGDTAAYVIYCHNRSIAIVANCDLALSVAVDHFIETYIVDETLVIPSNLVDFKAFSISAYKLELDEELLASSNEWFANRWNEALTKLGPEATDALQRLYNFYGTDWATWLFNLYDPDTGCFYYANSSRDYEGFKVDIESTCQALDILYSAGLFTELDNDWSKALPDVMRAKCLAYVQSLQDENDGYFYHPQWDRADVNSSRRGRDLSQAITLIRRMGGTPLYDTAIDNIGDATGPLSSVIASFMDTDSHKSTVEAVVDERFQSEENMLIYLESLDINGNSYAFGHTLSSETQQIIAAGLGEFVCDYIDEHQNIETGLWEDIDPSDPRSGYQAASGVIKIAAFYGAVNGAIKHGDKMLDTIINIILDDVKTSQITYVFNPWGALEAAIGSIKKANSVETAAGHEELYNEATLLQKIVSKLPALVEATIEKLEPYRHMDGSFSYNEDGTSLINPQGVIASLGYKEGDVNGQACAMHYVLGSIFGCLGIDRVPMLNYSDYIEFREVLESSGSVVKQELPAPELLDFEEGDIPVRVVGDVTVEGEKLDIVTVKDKEGEDTNALRITSIKDRNYAVSIEAKSASDKISCFTFSFDMCVESADSDEIYQIFLHNTTIDRHAYMIDVSVAGGIVYINDKISDGELTDPTWKTDLEIMERVGTWFNLKFEYYVLEDEGTGKTVAKIKVYKNDKLVKISDNHYVNRTSYNEPFFQGTMEKPEAIDYVNSVVFLARKSPASSILIDNVDCIPDTTTRFTDTPTTPGAGGIDEPDTVTNDIMDFESGELNELISGNGVFSVDTKATLDNANNKALKLDADAGEWRGVIIGTENTLIKKSVFTFEADVCLSDVLGRSTDGGFTHQILFCDVNAPVFMLQIGATDGGKIRLASDNHLNHMDLYDFVFDVNVDEWFNLKIEYYPVSDAEAYIKVYVNGNYVGTSDYYYDKNGGADVRTKINCMTIYERSDAECMLYLDNITFSYDSNKAYVPTPTE